MRASADEEAGGLDDLLKVIGLPQYSKAFPDNDDLEWFLQLRTVYFTRLVMTLRDVVFSNEDNDSEHKMARQVLTLAADVASQKELADDLTSLEHSATCVPDNDAKTKARESVIAAWATVLQRAAEVEVPDTKMRPRTTNQWNQYKQTCLMQMKNKHIVQLRVIMASDFPDADTKHTN